MELTIAGKSTRRITGNNYDVGAEILMVIFIILNAIKLTAFNMFMTSSNTLQAYMYKFSITFLLVSIVCLILMGLRSRILFATFYILQIIYIFINLVYYMYFHSYLHIYQAFALLSEGTGAAGILSILMKPELLIALLDLPVAIYMILIYPRVSAVFGKGYRMNRTGIVLTCLLILTATEGWNYMHKYSMLNLAELNTDAGESLMVQRYGTFANSIVDMVKNKNNNSMISKFSYGQQLASKGGNTDKPNLVIIQVESMDANAVNRQHNGQYIMPFLHSLAQQNVYYPYVMSYHEAGGTSDCEFSTMNSIEPLGDYPSIKIANYNYPNSIVRQLADSSYSTIAFHGNVGSYFNRDVAYPKMGYQELVDMTKMGLKDVGWGAPDKDVFAYAEKQLKDVKQPFFAYTITMTSHGPFTNADNYYNNSNYNDVQNKTSRDYMNSMSYVDQSIEDYVNYIRANFKNTYIFIWGDHTPNVNSDEYRQASFKDGNRYFEFVPLVIVTPDNKVYKEDKIVASFLDIAPTIANASGIPYNIRSNGIDLLNRPGSNPEIPFKGGNFDRVYLFDKIKQVN